MASPATEDLARCFWARAAKLHNAAFGAARAWGAIDAVAVPLDPPTEESAFNKASALYIHLFGMELAGALLLVVDGEIHLVASAKKCGAFEEALAKARPAGAPKLVLHPANKEDANAANIAALVSAVSSSKGGSVMGGLSKMTFECPLAVAWAAATEDKEAVDVSAALGALLAHKDDDAVGATRKAATLTNKILKHGAVARIEECFDQNSKVAHSAMASDVEAILEDPSKIKLKVSADSTESCYFPIIQSGGVYDVRPSATTNDDLLSDDVVIVALGARFKSYCANVARTFFVDPVPSVEVGYAALMGVRTACLAAMKVGEPLSGVTDAALAVLQQPRYIHLADKLPKNLGFGLGIDFREGSLVLNKKSEAVFAKNMVFNLAVGFQDLQIADGERAKALGAIKKLDAYSMLVADTVLVGADEAEVLTKHSVEWGDVSYFINEDDGAADDDGAAAAKQQKREADKLRAGKGGSSLVVEKRLRERADGDDKEAAGARDEKQAALMRSKLLQKRKKGGGKDGKAADGPLAKEIIAFNSTHEYPSEMPANEIHVDLEKLVVFIPINGAPVPFHISMIKNVVQPDADRAASYLRINFYTPGQSLGKDVPPATGALIERHGKDSVFVKEVLYRSREPRKLAAAYRMIQELRKRSRASAAKKAEEAGLVAQDKLVKMRDQRVPRMADLTMRPFMSGKKTTGTLEAHSNGLRFTSKKHEILDVMYANIKHALFQPCENEVMVLIHFHLHHGIMIGKKKSKDVQFFTEVVDASVALDAASRSMYDPDELDDEQRERQLRKKLNEMFKDFCKKLEKVAKHHSHDLEFDIPYRDLGFHGVPHREMVLIQPTVHCLVTLTETPFFIVELDDVEHVHFERCTMRSSNFDMVVVHKNFEQLPTCVNAIPMTELDSIQEWLTDCSLTYTAGQASMSWKGVMALVRADDRFYEDTDESGEAKPAGWQFLSADDWDELEKQAEKEDKRGARDDREAEKTRPSKKSKR
ncbi:FACT complex subunit-domain-containing protein [Pelagophyceae sp. CCMP2097]|nr:FACT complex subunit-domain-containing protein [Pelagophyceae sp. CCMP2097]